MKKTKNDIKLVFAIGNPEEEYANTRHNVGIYFTKKIIEKLNICITYKKKLTCFISKYLSEEKEEIIFAISNSYMNNSGSCLLQIMNYYKIKVEEILIVHDDMVLECSEILIKFNGSPHGHNGLKDIIEKIKTKKFYKMRIGIGKPKYQSENINYVLNRFQLDEQKKIDEKITSILNKLQESKFLNIIKNLE